MKITGNGPLKDCVLHFNGNEHKLNVVIAKAGSAPVIDVQVADIDLDKTLEARTEYHEIDGLEPAIIKHGGKFQILLGRDRIIGSDKTAIKARLVTSVALKDARIVKELPAASTPNTVPFNPPRFTGQRDAWDRPYKKHDTPRYQANAGPSPEQTRTGDHIRSDSTRPAASYPTSGSRYPSNGNRSTYGKPFKKSYP